jgi:hypothetical protein
MRWLAWLFTGTTCLAGYGGPLPEIAVGTGGRELVIQSAPRLPENEASQAFLVGTVTEVAAEEDRQCKGTPGLKKKDNDLNNSAFCWFVAG